AAKSNWPEVRPFGSRPVACDSMRSNGCGRCTSAETSFLNSTSICVQLAKAFTSCTIRFSQMDLDTAPVIS
ncbi:unnamed protein product, partial [Nesidiocoris tenuis]